MESKVRKSGSFHDTRTGAAGMRQMGDTEINGITEGRTVLSQSKARHKLRKGTCQRLEGQNCGDEQHMGRRNKPSIGGRMQRMEV